MSMKLKLDKSVISVKRKLNHLHLLSMNFLPEFRKASTLIGGQVSFGTLDCTIHSAVCNQHSIRSYPSTIFFNNSKPHKFQVGSNI